MRPLFVLFLVSLIACEKPQKDLTGIYSDNRAFAFIYRENGKEGLLDTNMTIILPAQFDYIEDWQVDNLIRVDSGGERLKGGDVVGYTFRKYGLITAEGQIVSRPKFDYLIVSDSSALVLFEGLYGYIDNKGDWILLPQFEEAYPFYKGTAVVKKGNKYELMNKLGGRVINQIFDTVYRFKNGVAIASVGKKWALINYRGKYLLPPAYYGGLGEYNYYYGTFMKDDGKWYLIDTAGNIPIKDGFDEVQTRAEGDVVYAVGRKKGKPVKMRLN